jgi:hypothetical protein
MNVYVYRAALYCETCGLHLKDSLTLPEGADLANEATWDSDRYPKGPYQSDIAESEADCPQHCDHCDVFLENPLTLLGYDSVYQMVINALHAKSVSDNVIEYIGFYDISVTDLLGYATESSQKGDPPPPESA